MEGYHHRRQSRKRFACVIDAIRKVMSKVDIGYSLQAMRMTHHAILDHPQQPFSVCAEISCLLKACEFFHPESRTDIVKSFLAHSDLFKMERPDCRCKCDFEEKEPDVVSVAALVKEIQGHVDDTKEVTWRDFPRWSRSLQMLSPSHPDHWRVDDEKMFPRFTDGDPQKIQQFARSFAADDDSGLSQILGSLKALLELKNEFSALNNKYINDKTQAAIDEHMRIYFHYSRSASTSPEELKKELADMVHEAIWDQKMDMLGV